MEEDGRKVRLCDAYEHLRNKGLAHTRQDVADKMGKGKSRISEAFSGKISNKFLESFNAAFGNIFNLDWLTDGVGDMLCCPPTSGDEIFQQNNVTGDNNMHIGDAVLAKENEMLKQRLAEMQKQLQEKQDLIDKLISKL